jgi:hypothetical protein
MALEPDLMEHSLISAGFWVELVGYYSVSLAARDCVFVQQIE